MQFQTPEFLLETLPVYFANKCLTLFQNAPATAWRDVHSPFSLYHILTRFVDFARTLCDLDSSVFRNSKSASSVFSSLLETHFILNNEQLQAKTKAQLSNSSLSEILIESPPLVHRLLIQVFLRLNYLDSLSSSGEFVQHQHSAEAKILQRVISQIRFIDIENEGEEGTMDILEYIFKVMAQKCQSHNTLQFLRLLLRKTELPFSGILEKCLVRSRPPTRSQFIDQFTEVPMNPAEKKSLINSIKKEKQNAAGSHNHNQAPHTPAPKQTGLDQQSTTTTSSSNNPIYKSPATGTSRTPGRGRSHKKQENLEKVRAVPTRPHLAQRTIFEVKNKKFVPKKIQYVAESTATSSCSTINSVSYQTTSSLKRILFSTKSKDEKPYLIDATPIKVDKEVTRRSMMAEITTSLWSGDASSTNSSKKHR